MDRYELGNWPLCLWLINSLAHCAVLFPRSLEASRTNSLCLSDIGPKIFTSYYIVFAVYQGQGPVTS